MAGGTRNQEEVVVVVDFGNRLRKFQGFDPGRFEVTRSEINAEQRFNFWRKRMSAYTEMISPPDDKNLVLFFN